MCSSKPYASCISGVGSRNTRRILPVQRSYSRHSPALSGFTILSKNRCPSLLNCNGMISGGSCPGDSSCTVVTCFVVIFMLCSVKLLSNSSTEIEPSVLPMPRTLPLIASGTFCSSEPISRMVTVVSCAVGCSGAPSSTNHALSLPQS